MFEDLPVLTKSLIAFRSRVLMLSGPVARSDQELTLLYIGNGNNLSFVSHAVFGRDIEQREIGRCNIWRAGAQAKAHADGTDMTVVDVPWPYDISMPNDERIVEVPAWLRQQTTLGDTWENTIAGLRKSVRDSQLRKIRKYKLTHASTDDPVDVDRFYDTMYVPHVERRFGGAATVESRKHVQNCVAGGTLLNVLRDGEVISASVLLDDGDTLRMLFNGFPARDLREIDGASAGLYYYTLAYALENGYKHVDFCGSRPFLNDGVLAVKRRWGAGLIDDFSLENLLLQLNRWSPGVRSFLSDHPLITCEDDGLVGKVLVAEGELTADRVKKTARQFISPGVDGLKIFGLQGIADDAIEAARSAAVPVEVLDLRDSSDPARIYCD